MGGKGSGRKVEFKITPEKEFKLENLSGVKKYGGIVFGEKFTRNGTDDIFLDEAYWDGNYSIDISVGPFTYTRGVITYLDRFSGWTANHAEKWAESGGEWTYSGDYGDSGVRKFLVTYSYSLDGFSNTIWFSNVGRLTKDTGAGHVEIAGSVQACSQFAFVGFLGVYLERHTVSNSTIVSMEEGDKLAFQTGWHCSGSGTYILGGINGLLLGYPSLPVKGFHVNITPIDIYR